MAIMATDSGGGGDFKPVPAGNHLGVCSMVVDLGKQRIQSAQYGESVKHQVYIAWELPHEQMQWVDKDGVERTGPMRIGRTYTLSLHENAALRAHLESWRGRAFTEEERKGFDIVNLGGVAAMVNVLHAEKNGKTYANVAGVTPLPRGMERPALADAALIYDADTPSTYDHLPAWLQKKVDEQVKDEPKHVGGGGTSYDEDLNDDVPFITGSPSMEGRVG